MISKAKQKELLKLLGYKDEDITNIVDAEDEQDIELPEGKVYTKKELDEIKNNYVTSKKDGFYNAGKEFAIKEMKDKEGLEFEGKDYDTFLEAYKSKVLKDADINPTEAKKRHEEEKKSLQEKLIAEQKRVQEKEAELKNLSFERQLLASFPKGETILPHEDILTLAKARLQEKTEGDTTIYSYKGADLKDDKESYLDLSASVAHIFKSEGWLKEAAADQSAGEQKKKGLGFGDTGSTLGNYKSFDEFSQSLQERGIEIGSDAANKELQAAMAKNPKLLDAA